MTDILNRNSNKAPIMDDFVRYFIYYCDYWGTNTFIVNIFITLCLTFNWCLIETVYQFMDLSPEMHRHIKNTLYIVLTDPINAPLQLDDLMQVMNFIDNLLTA